MTSTAAGVAFSQPWATSLSAGPADEAGQALTFVVSVGPLDALKFDAPPSIDSNGTLTFTPNALFLGPTTVTVHLEDNGGTANGGEDATPDQTFTIN